MVAEPSIHKQKRTRIETTLKKKKGVLHSGTGGLLLLLPLLSLFFPSGIYTTQRTHNNHAPVAREGSTASATTPYNSISHSAGCPVGRRRGAPAFSFLLRLRLIPASLRASYSTGESAPGRGLWKRNSSSEDDLYPGMETLARSIQRCWRRCFPASSSCCCY